MGRKPAVPPKVIHAAQALDTSFNSDESNISGVDKASYLCTYSGLTGTGTFKVQAGARDPRLASNVVRWADLDLDPIAVDSSVASSGTFQFNLGSELAAERVRLVYTKGTASAGTVEIMVYLSTVGA